MEDEGHDCAWCLLTDKPVHAQTYKKRKHDQLECVICDEAHPVFWKQLKHERFYKPACFSHFPTKNSNSSGKSGICCGRGESAEHVESKFLLKEMLGRYKFLVSRCLHCNLHDIWECGDNATVEIERKVKSKQGNRYFYDACLCRDGKPTYALEVWHTHETKHIKVKETKEMGIAIAEFTTEDILQMKNLDTASNRHYILTNLLREEFTCTACQKRIDEFKRQEAESKRQQAEERDRQHKERIAKQTQLDFEKKQREKEQERIRMEHFKAEQIRRAQQSEEDAKKRKENEIRQQSEEAKFKENIEKERERARRHDEECYSRVLWCLQEGGPDFYPAHEHKHRAQGNWCYQRKCVVTSNDQNFFHGIPPWHPDGSVNLAGVRPNYGPTEPLGKNFQFLDDYNSGWECRRCQKWISHAPQEYRGQSEPHDWWWCFECKKSCEKKLSLSEKRIANVAATCLKINSLFGIAKDKGEV